MHRSCLAAAALLALAGPASAEPAKLRAAPVASGPAITLGDLFENAGEAADRAVAPAPPPGRTASLSATLIASAAAAAGLDWSAPEGMTRLDVARAGGGVAAPAGAISDGVRRGDMVAVRLIAPGLSIAIETEALADAAIGERVRLLNPDSKRVIEAIVTGPGAAVLDRRGA